MKRKKDKCKRTRGNKNRALFPQCTARTDAVHCRSGCSALRKRLQCTAGKGHIMADERPVLWRTALQAAFVVCYLYRGRCPRLLRVVPSWHRSACGSFLPRIMRIGRMSVLWRGSEQNINQKNPLERMEGCALMSCFRLGLIRASS